jgi:hypothetical protein
MDGTTTYEFDVVKVPLARLAIASDAEIKTSAIAVKLATARISRLMTARYSCTWLPVVKVVFKKSTGSGGVPSMSFDGTPLQFCVN